MPKQNDNGAQGLTRAQLKAVVDYADKCAKGEQVLPVPAPRTAPRRER